MEIVEIKGVRFGDGYPKICVPIVGHSEDEIIDAAKALKAEAERLKAPGAPGLDVIEFRADYYDDVTNKVLLIELMKRLRDIFSEEILLFTYRSEEEGGELRHDRAENMVDDIYDWVIESGLADMIDIELMQGAYYVARMATKAHDRGIKVIISYHNFEETPHNSYIMDRLREMEILGGDILKFAAMPKNEFDVRRLMELTELGTGGGIMCRHELEPDPDISAATKGKRLHPLVTVSMGELGRESRINGKVTGSAMTFAFFGAESAPGQVPLSEMIELLK